MTRHYLMIGAEGEQLFRSVPAGRRLPVGAVEVPRLPGPFERWDVVAGAWVRDAAAAADERAGDQHIALMRARKAIEAHLIVAGVSAPGMLIVREAETRGIAAEALAAVVIEKAAAAEALEIERQAASLTGSKEIMGG